MLADITLPKEYLPLSIVHNLQMPVNIAEGLAGHIERDSDEFDLLRSYAKYIQQTLQHVFLTSGHVLWVLGEHSNNVLALQLELFTQLVLIGYLHAIEERQ